MNELAVFAGAGGGILGGQLLGWRTVCAVENDEYARSVLLARQNDGRFAPFPVWDDVRTFDGRPWRGVVGVCTGGFPCQDIAACGKGAGINGSKSGLWREMARIIEEVQPRIVFVENSPMLTVRGLGRVLGDLASMGFDQEYGVLGAHHAGAPHKRDRIWVLARHPDRNRQPTISVNAEMAGVPGMVANANRSQRERDKRTKRKRAKHADTCGASWWKTEPPVGRVVDELAARPLRHRAHQLRAIGNGQVPACMALAYRILEQRMNER